MPTLADQFMARFDNVPDGEIRTGIAAHANSTGTAQLERERADAAMKMSYGDTPTFVRNLSEGAIGSAGSTLTALQSTFGRPSDESRGALDNRAASAQRLDPSLMGDITRGVGGLVADLPLMGATAGIGGLGAVGRLGNMGRTAILNAPIAVREGVNTGADKGVSAGLSAGAIEGVIPALFGMRGLEKLFGHAASAAARAGMSKGYIRELAAEAGSQISEEMVGEASHALDEYARGDASALDPTNLGRRLMVAGAVGGVGGSLGGVSHAIHDVIDTATGADQQRSVDELIAQQETAGAGVMSLGGDDPAVMDARKRDPARARMIAAEQGALVKERARQVLVKIAPELANSPDPIVAINTLRNSSDPAIQAKIDEAFGNLGGVKVNIDGQSPEVSSVGQPTTLPGVVANRRGILDSGGTTAEMRMSPQEVSARDESVRADDATRQAELAAKREGADARQKFDSENAPVRRDAEQSLRDLTKLRRSTPLPNRELDALISEQQAVIDEHVAAEADAATRVIGSADTAKVNQAETLKESDGELASIRRERDNAASQVKRSKAADARVVDATANDPAATFEASIAGEPDAIPASERPATVSTPSKQQPIKDTVDPEIIHAAENAVLSKYGFAPNPDSAAASTPLAHDENFKEVLRPLPRPSKDLMAGLAEDARRGNSDAKQALTSIRSYSATKVGWAKEDRNQSSDPKTYRGAEERANVLTEVKAAKADALNRAMNDERQVRQRDRQLNAEQKAAQSPPINASSDPGVTVNTPDLSVEPPVGGVTAVRQARLEGINARLAAAKAKAASLKPTPDAPNVVAARNTLNAESARIDEGRDSPTQATADLLQSAETDAASKLAQLKAERDALRPTKPTPVAEASQDADTSVKPPETTTPPDVTPAATTPESAAPHRALTEDDRNRLDEAVTAVIASMQSTLGIGKPTAEYDERGAVIRVEGKGGGASVGVRLASRAEIDDVRFNSDNRRAVYHSYVNAGDNTNRQGPPKGTGAHAGRYTLNEFLALSPAMAKKAVAGTTVPSFLVVSPTHQTTVMPSDAVIYLDKQTWANHPDSVAEEITHLATIGFATDSQMAAMAKELAAKGVISEATANNPPHALRLSSELHEALAAEISSEITMRRDAAAANRTFKKPGLSDAIAKTISPISTWVTNLIRKVFPTFRAVVKTEKASATQIQQFADGLLGGQVVDQTFVGPESTDHLEDTRRAAEVAQYEADVKKQSTADREVRRVASEARAKARQAEAKDNAIRTAVRKQDLAGYKVDAAKSKHAKAGEITAKEERLRAIIDEIAAANAERQTADGEDAGNANDDIAATVDALRLEREQLRQDIKVLRSQTGQSGAALGEIAAAKDATASGEDVKIKAGMTASTVFSTRKDNRAEQGLDPEQRDFERDNRLTLTPRTREDSRAEGQRILTGLADKAGVTPGSMAYDQTMLDMVRTRMAAMIDAEANGDSTAGASDTDIGTLQILMAYARNRVSRFSSGKSSGADQGNAGILADKLAKETALMSSMNASLMGRSFAMLNDGVMRPIDRLTHLRDLMSAPSEATAKKAKALYRAGKGDEAYELTKAEAVANFKASKKALEDRGWGIDDLFNDEPGAGAFFSTANGNRQFVGLAKDLMAHKLGFQFWRFLGGMYQNNLLGIVTQGINVTSNTAYLVTQMMGVKPLEAIIGSTLKARGKDWHGITMAGYAEMVKGMTNSGVWGRALSNMIGSVKEGHSLLEEKTVGRLRQAGLDVGEFDDPMHYNRFTKLFTLSRRLSTGMDEVFSTVWYEAHLRAEAYALANRKGVPTADRAAFIDKMVARPSPTLRDDAGKAAAKMVFRADFTQGGLTNLINNIRKGNTSVGFGAMLAIPFLNTLVNITKETAKIAPITSIPTALYRIHRDSKRDGKFATKTAVEGGANVLFAAVLTMAVAGLTDDDDISGTGIPYSLEHQAEWEKEQRNLQSRTVHIPLTNRRIRLDYMAPLGLAITQAADIRNAISGKITWGAAFGNSWRSMIGEQYVQGVVKTLKAWGDGDPQSFDKWSKDTLAGFVPYAATQRDVDHGIRGATDAGDSKMLTKSLASDSVGVDQSAKMFARDVVRKGAPTIADVMFDKREVDVDLAGNADQGRLIRKPGSGVVLAWDKWLDEYNTVAAKKGDKRWYPPAIRAELPGDAGKMTEEQFAVADSTYAKLLSERLTDPTGVPFEAGYQRRLASIFTKARADARRIASVDGKH